MAREEKAVERVRAIRHGHGKNAWTEQHTTRLVRIEGLTTYDAYADPQQTGQRNRADYTPERLSAAVVQT